MSVEKGLKDGDRVISSALVKLREGRVVTPTDTTATQGIQAILQKNNLMPQGN